MKVKHIPWKTIIIEDKHYLLIGKEKYLIPNIDVFFDEIKQDEDSDSAIRKLMNRKNFLKNCGACEPF